MPSLENVAGAFHVESTGAINQDCKFFKSIQSYSIHGPYECESTGNPTTRSGLSGTTTSSGGSAAATTTSGIAVANGVDMPTVGVVAAAFYALAQLF
jgi:hypothetical protein